MLSADGEYQLNKGVAGAVTGCIAAVVVAAAAALYIWFRSRLRSNKALRLVGSDSARTASVQLQLFKVPRGRLVIQVKHAWSLATLRNKCG